MASDWRIHSRNVLARLLEQAYAEAWDLARLKQAIFDVYPFGQRHYMPYQIWLSEKKLCLHAYDLKVSMDHMEHVNRVRTNGRRKKSEKNSELQVAMEMI